MKTQVLGLILLACIFVFVSCQKEEDNTIPIPALSVDPPEGSVSTIFIFDASQSYDDQDPASMLEVRWDWNGDGRWDTEWSTEKVEEYKFDNCCMYTVKLEVRDSDGWSNMGKASIKVYQDSVPPVASFLCIPAVQDAGREIRFDASNSFNASGDGNVNLQFRWDYNSDGVWDTDYNSNHYAYHTYFELGEQTVTLEVINSFNLIAQVSRKVFIN